MTWNLSVWNLEVLVKTLQTAAPLHLNDYDHKSNSHCSQMISLHLLWMSQNWTHYSFLWKQHVVIELAPHHGTSPCTVVIMNPFIFYRLFSTSVTARLAPHLFFFPFLFFSPLMFWKGMGPKLRIADKESRFVPCQLKISCRERMRRRIGRGLIEAEHSQVIRVWSEAGWETCTFHKSSYLLINNPDIYILCMTTHTVHQS